MAATVQQDRNPTPTTTPKITRSGLSLAERIKVIEARKMGKSMRQLAAQFGCGKTQILNTLAQKERYICEWELMGRNNPFFGARKRFRHTRNEQINRSVHEWYQQQIANGARITGPMLQKQARQYANHFGISKFTASNGWLANFRKFYCVVNFAAQLKLQKSSGILNVIPPIKDRAATDKHSENLSSKYCSSTEFVPVKTSTKEDRKCCCFVESDQKDQLLENSIPHTSKLVQQQIQLSAAFTHFKLKPKSDSDARTSQFISASKVKSRTSIMCSIPSKITPSEEYSSAREELMTGHHVVENKKPNTSSASIHHRKRRLLQSEHNNDLPAATISNKTLRPESNTVHVDERRIPELVPITQNGVYLAEFLNLARAKRLLVLSVKDDCGHEWVEIRQSVASYRVPKLGYPTHLSRLIVDSSLHFFLEVLGHCVQSGSLLFNDSSMSFNYTEATSVLNAVSGEYVVCAGIESLTDRSIDLHMKTVQELGSSGDMYATLPDYRFRSNECAKWIDYRLGPKCFACKSVTDVQTSEFSAAPIDLRCTPSHLKN